MVGALHIGVLALQGAFREHRLALESCGAKVTEIRRRPGDSACAGLEKFDGIVLPGGESTVMGRLLEEEGLLEPLQACARMGMPVYGSCAGLILMCREVEDADGSPRKQPVLGLLDARVRRNAFGRQTESFETRLDVAGAAGDMEAVFIRAAHCFPWAGCGGAFPGGWASRPQPCGGKAGQSACHVVSPGTYGRQADTRLFSESVP